MFFWGGRDVCGMYEDLGEVKHNNTGSRLVEDNDRHVKTEKVTLHE